MGPSPVSISSVTTCAGQVKKCIDTILLFLIANNLGVFSDLKCEHQVRRQHRTVQNSFHWAAQLSFAGLRSSPNRISSLQTRIARSVLERAQTGSTVRRVAGIAASIGTDCHDTLHQKWKKKRIRRSTKSRPLQEAVSQLSDAITESARKDGVQESVFCIFACDYCTVTT